MGWQCKVCGKVNPILTKVCRDCGAKEDGTIEDAQRYKRLTQREALTQGKAENSQPIAQTNMEHWIVLVVAIIVASIGFFYLIRLSLGTGLIELAIFLAIIARIVQADLHHKSQKQK